MEARIFIVANLLVAVTCVWAVLSPRVNDGLFGKIVLVFLCFSCVACAGWAWEYPETVDRSETVMTLAVACMAVRCYWIKRYAASAHRILRRKRNAAKSTFHSD